MKTLNVTKVSREVLLKKWAIHGKFLPKGELFMRCNAQGKINWDKAPVYSWPELVDEMKRRKVLFPLEKGIFELP